MMLDVFLPDEHHGLRSAQGLRAAYDQGAIRVCDVVYAELVPAFNGVPGRGGLVVYLKSRG